MRCTENASFAQGIEATNGYLTAKQAAAYLHISMSTFYKLTSAGRITYYKPNGKLILLKRSELDQWLENSKVPSNDEIRQNQKSQP